MRWLAIYGIIIFGLMIIHCISNLVLGLGYEMGNSIVGLVVSAPIFILCSLYLWKETRKEMKHSTAISKFLRYLAPYNIIVFGLIAIYGIYNIIFGREYGISITITGLIIVIPMLIFCHRYLKIKGQVSTLDIFH